MNGSCTAKLGELCEVAAGGTPARSKSEYFGGTIPWVKISDMLQGTVLTTDERISVAGLKNSAAKVFPVGTVLISIFATIGRTAILGIEASTNQAIAGVTPRDAKLLDSGFLRHYFDASRVKLESIARGAAQPNINLGILKNLDIPVPPFPEQRRIAAILDQADALRAKRREALAQLDSLTQSIFIEMFGDDGANAKFPLGGIRAFVDANSGKSAKAVLSELKTDIPIYGGNGINGWATKALYDQPVIVFGRVGQQCGNAYITSGPSWVTDNAIVVRIVESDKLNADYLLHAFEKSDFSNRVKHLDLPFINQGMILDNPIPLPPLPVQQTFATRIQSVEALKATHNAALQELDRLFASLQHRAFQGEL